MENEKESKELKPFKWQGPDGAIHTVSVQKQIEQAAAIKAHNETVDAMRCGGVPKHGLRKPRE
jgi:hypothetical protein